jgi:hypothetical protein
MLESRIYLLSRCFPRVTSTSAVIVLFTSHGVRCHIVYFRVMNTPAVTVIPKSYEYSAVTVLFTSHGVLQLSQCLFASHEYTCCHGTSQESRVLLPSQCLFSSHEVLQPSRCYSRVTGYSSCHSVYSRVTNTLAVVVLPKSHEYFCCHSVYSRVTRYFTSHGVIHESRDTPAVTVFIHESLVLSRKSFLIPFHLIKIMD